jgi:hypothetical protein
MCTVYCKHYFQEQDSKANFGDSCFFLGASSYCLPTLTVYLPRLYFSSSIKALALNLRNGVLLPWGSRDHQFLSSNITWSWLRHMLAQLLWNGILEILDKIVEACCPLQQKTRFATHAVSNHASRWWMIPFTLRDAINMFWSSRCAFALPLIILVTRLKTIMIEADSRLNHSQVDTGLGMTLQFTTGEK